MYDPWHDQNIKHLNKEEQDKLKNSHIELEKQYLKILMQQEFQGEFEEKAIKHFNETIQKKFPESKTNILNFIKYVKGGRKQGIQFDSEEEKIYQNDHKLKDVLIYFHEMVGIFIKTTLIEKNYLEFTSYFTKLDKNISGCVLHMLEELFKETEWKDRIQLLKEITNKQDQQNQNDDLIKEKQDCINDFENNLFDQHVKLEVTLIIFFHNMPHSQIINIILSQTDQIKIDQDTKENIIKFRLRKTDQINYITQNDHNEQLTIFHSFCNQLQEYIKSKKTKIIEDFLSKIKLDFKIHVLELIKQLLGDTQIKQLINQLDKFIDQYEQTQQNDKKFGMLRECYSIYKNFIHNNSFKVLLLGRTGTGKSTLGNDLIQNLSINKNLKHFNNSDQYYGGTKIFENIQINFENVQIEIIDSPGFGDVDVDIYQMIKSLYSQGTINLIIYCFNATIFRQHRLDTFILTFIQGLYKSDWNSFYVCLNFTDCLKNTGQKFDEIIKFLNQNLNSNIPAENLIQDNKISRIKEIILSSYKKNAYQSGFTRLRIPLFSQISEKAAQFMV